MGERGSNGSSVFEIHIERRRFGEIAQVFKSGRVFGDVLLVRRFQ